MNTEASKGAIWQCSVALWISGSGSEVCMFAPLSVEVYKEKMKDLLRPNIEALRVKARYF